MEGPPPGLQAQLPSAADSPSEPLLVSPMKAALISPLEALLMSPLPSQAPLISPSEVPLISPSETPPISASGGDCATAVVPSEQPAGNAAPTAAEAVASAGGGCSGGCGSEVARQAKAPPKQQLVSGDAGSRGRKGMPAVESSVASDESPAWQQPRSLSEVRCFPLL